MLLCVTNRHLCEGDFLTQLEQIAQARPTAILLREKDLAPPAYQDLVERVTSIVAAYGVPLWRYPPPLPTDRIDEIWHLPYPQFLSLLEEHPALLATGKFGVSVHAPAEAEFATRHGASYLIAGHLFPTDCKPGLAGRGVSFLRAIVTATQRATLDAPEQAVPPVYAIGGITPAHCQALRQAGAAGVCVMSALMKSQNPVALIQAYQAQWECEPCT